jgi:hypothetical protein
MTGWVFGGEAKRRAGLKTLWFYTPRGILHSANQERTVTHYIAFGLKIDSEIPLPETLPSSPGPSDVCIRFKPVPTALPDPLTDGGYFQATSDTFLLKVTDVARYLVVNGREIWIDPLPNIRIELIRIYLLGSAFGALLHQRHLLVMHASSIQTERGTVLFVGNSGHGKSTLAAAMVQRGYALLADDVTAVSVKSPSAPVAVASFPCMRLCADAAARFDYPLDSLPRIQSPDGQDKYVVPAKRFCTDPLPIHAIYSLCVDADPSIRLEPVDTGQRFAIVGNNTYRYVFLKALGLLQMHFQAATQVAKSVHIGRITRPATPFMLDELVDRLEVEFGGPTGAEQMKEIN